MANEVITLSHADIYQKEALVLSDVNFGIEEGEFVYLIGKTGSGKSSLLKTLYADLWLEKGSGAVAGFQLEKITPKEVPYLRRKIDQGACRRKFYFFTGILTIFTKVVGLKKKEPEL